MSPLDTVVTKKTIYELALHNHIVRAFTKNVGYKRRFR